MSLDKKEVKNKQRINDRLFRNLVVR